eukprot:6625970-Prymnesium_polylepis.1
MSEARRKAPTSCATPRSDGRHVRSESARAAAEGAVRIAAMIVSCTRDAFTTERAPVPRSISSTYGASAARDAARAVAAPPSKAT